MPTIVMAVADPVLLTLLKEWLLHEDFQAIGCLRSIDAREQIERSRPDAVVLEGWLEHRTAGWELLAALRAEPATAGIPAIAITDTLAESTPARRYLDAGTLSLIAKPFCLDDLVAELRRLTTPSGAPAGSAHHLGGSLPALSELGATRDWPLAASRRRRLSIRRRVTVVVAPEA